MISIKNNILCNSYCSTKLSNVPYSDFPQTGDKVGNTELGLGKLEHMSAGFNIDPLACKTTTGIDCQFYPDSTASPTNEFQVSRAQNSGLECILHPPTSPEDECAQTLIESQEKLAHRLIQNQWTPLKSKFTSPSYAGELLLERNSSCYSSWSTPHEYGDDFENGDNFNESFTFSENTELVSIQKIQNSTNVNYSPLINSYSFIFNVRHWIKQFVLGGHTTKLVNMLRIPIMAALNVCEAVCAPFISNTPAAQQSLERRQADAVPPPTALASAANLLNARLPGPFALNPVLGSEEHPPPDAPGIFLPFQGQANAGRVGNPPIAPPPAQPPAPFAPVFAIHDPFALGPMPFPLPLPFPALVPLPLPLPAPIPDLAAPNLNAIPHGPPATFFTELPNLLNIP